MVHDSKERLKLNLEYCVGVSGQQHLADVSEYCEILHFFF